MYTKEELLLLCTNMSTQNIARELLRSRNEVTYQRAKMLQDPEYFIALAHSEGCKAGQWLTNSKNAKEVVHDFNEDRLKHWYYLILEKSRNGYFSRNPDEADFIKRIKNDGLMSIKVGDYWRLKNMADRIIRGNTLL